MIDAWLVAVTLPPDPAAPPVPPLKSGLSLLSLPLLLALPPTPPRLTESNQRLGLPAKVAVMAVLLLVTMTAPADVALPPLSPRPEPLVPLVPLLVVTTAWAMAPLAEARANVASAATTTDASRRGVKRTRPDGRAPHAGCPMRGSVFHTAPGCVPMP